MIRGDKPTFKGVKMSELVNRAFMYGESVFTTMRMINGVLRDWDDHFTRLKEGVSFIYGPFTDGDDWPIHFKNRLEERFLDESGDRVIRLTIYREQDRGLLKTGLVSIRDLKIALHSTPFDSARNEGRMFKLRTCSSPIRPHWWPSSLKAGNYLETILNQKLFMQPGDDDVLFLSPQDTVLESSVANIFILRHNRLYTAPLGPNVLDGVMRKKVLAVAAEFFDGVEETASTLEQLFKADGMIGTNSIRGPFLIDRIDEHEMIYSQDFLEKFERLRKRVFL